MRFPLFVDLTGVPVTIVGGGNIALRRAEALGRFGARLTVIAPVLKAPIAGAAVLRRPYENGDLEGAALALAATDSREVNHAVFLEGRALGIPVNICDCPEECSFFFPALCEAEGLVAGVAGDGRDHRRTARAAAAIRTAWEDLL